MHDSSYRSMTNFVEKYLDKTKPLTILDVGSREVSGGTYKPLLSNENWRYVGGDIVSGPNVDVVFKSVEDWGLPEQYDVIISGQTLEHVEDTHQFILQIKKYIKPGGLICIIAPWEWKRHLEVDCWRVLEDGMRFLLVKLCGFMELEIFLLENDCVGIAQAYA